MSSEDFQFPKVLVINLDHRTDRWLHTKGLCESVGIDPIRVSAIRQSPGHIGAALSTIKCVNMAKEMELPWVLVLEDDCNFTKEAWDRFCSYLPILWKRRNEWNYFNGGPTYISRISPWDKETKLASGHALTTHFALYNNTVYDKFSSWITERGPIDVWLRNVSPCIFGFPMIANQLSDFSDTEGKIQEYDWIFDMFTKKLEPIFDLIFKDDFVGVIPNCDNLTPIT